MAEVGHDDQAAVAARSPLRLSALRSSAGSIGRYVAREAVLSLLQRIAATSVSAALSARGWEMEPQGSTLKAKLKSNEGQLNEPTRVRIHRAISWLSRAEKEESDLDARFIFLWISFNAVYANEFGFETSERDLLNSFLSKLVGADSGRRLHKILFENYSGPIRVLIDNRFVFEPFWRALRDHDSSGSWETKFAASQKVALRSLLGEDATVVLGVVFDRLYVLRNQLVHGGSTWNSKVNRSQVKDGANLLYALIPTMIDLMLDHPELDLANIAYPVV